MLEQNFMWVKCTIENSGFSSERRFEVELPEDGKIVGAANVEYLLDSDHEPLPDDIPPYGHVVEGYVKCRLIRQSEEGLIVEFPGTDVFHVPKEALLTRS